MWVESAAPVVVAVAVAVMAFLSVSLLVLSSESIWRVWKGVRRRLILVLRQALPVWSIAPAFPRATRTQVPLPFLPFLPLPPLLPLIMPLVRAL